MNIKLSQLPTDNKLNGSEVFPILSNGANFIAPISAIYTFLSGDNIINVTTNYNSNSSYLLDGAKKANIVYSVYTVNSGNYVLQNSQEVTNWDFAFTTVSANYLDWNSATTVIQQVSGLPFIISDTTMVPSSSAITNIVAITQQGYNELPYIDPYTYYVIAQF